MVSSRPAALGSRNLLKMQTVVLYLLSAESETMGLGPDDLILTNPLYDSDALLQANLCHTKNPMHFIVKEPGLQKGLCSSVEKE